MRTEREAVGLINHPAVQALETAKQQLFVVAYATHGNATRAAAEAGYEADARTPSGYDTLRAIASENLTKPHIREAVNALLAERIMGKEEALARLSDEGRGLTEECLRYSTLQRRERRYVPVAQALAELEVEIEVEREALRRMEVGDSDDLLKMEQRRVRLEVWAEEQPDRLVEVDGPVVEETRVGLDLKGMRERGLLHLIKELKYDEDGRLADVKLYDAQAAKDKILRAHGVYGREGITTNVQVSVQQNNAGALPPPPP